MGDGGFLRRLPCRPWRLLPQAASAGTLPEVSCWAVLRAKRLHWSQVLRCWLMNEEMTCIASGAMIPEFCRNPGSLVLSALHCRQSSQALVYSNTSLRTLGHQATFRTVNKVFSRPRCPPEGLTWKYRRNSGNSNWGTTTCHFPAWFRASVLRYNTPWWLKKVMWSPVDDDCAHGLVFLL